MKGVSLPFVAASFMACGASALAEYEVHLRGIFNLAEWQGALLEVNHSLARSNRPPNIITTTRLVKPGEKFEDPTIKGAHVNFEILEINIESESVKLRENGEVSVYGMERTVGAALTSKPGIELQGARFEDVLDLYFGFKSRTLLIHPHITWSPVSFRAAAQNEMEITAALEKSFLDLGIATVADGDKFVMMVPTSLVRKITPHSKDLDPASPQFGSTLLHGPISTAIENYGRILDLVPIAREPIPGTLIFLRTRILSRAEMLYAYDTLFEWNGLKVVVIDDKNFKVVRLPDANAQ